VSRRFAWLLGSWVGLVVAGLGACDHQDIPAQCRSSDNLALFDDRIAPLLSADNQSTCNECHLAGVDLGLYAKSEDECTTMACMVESGIVDLEAPEQSVVLTWILRATPASSLITPEVVQAEHDGVLEWVEFHAACGRYLCPEVEDPCGAGPVGGSCEAPPSGHDLPAHGFDDPGDCSDLTIERAFSELVYPWRARCFPCHYDTQPNAPADAPRWVVDAGCEIGSLASMRNVLELGLVDVAQPDQSLLLLKPLAESAGGLMHGGDDKFFDTADGAYNDFKTWVELYAGCQ